MSLYWGVYPHAEATLMMRTTLPLYWDMSIVLPSASYRGTRLSIKELCSITDNYVTS